MSSSRASAPQGGRANAKAQLDLAEPDIDFVRVGNGLGVPSRRVDTVEQPHRRPRQRAIAEPGPHLIEVVIPAETQAPAVAGHS